MRIHDQKFAAALGFEVAKKPKAIAKAKLKASEAAHADVTSILSCAMPKKADDFKTDIEDIKAVYFAPMGGELRRRVKARLDLLYKTVIRLAQRDPTFAARARRFVPLSLLPKSAPPKRAKKQSAKPRRGTVAMKRRARC